MSMCRVFSGVVGIGCLLWPVCSLGKTVLAFALLHSVLQGQIFLLCQVSLPTFEFQSPMMKGHLFWVSVLDGLVDLHRTVQLLQHYWLRQTWITMILNGLPWKWTEITLSFLRLHPSTAFWILVDYEGSSIFSKVFLQTIVDIIVIWVKFTHSSPFEHTDF